MQREARLQTKDHPGCGDEQHQLDQRLKAIIAMQVTAANHIETRSPFSIPAHALPSVAHVAVIET
jgi:hypothetical protein